MCVSSGGNQTTLKLTYLRRGSVFRTRGLSSVIKNLHSAESCFGGTVVVVVANKTLQLSHAVELSIKARQTLIYFRALCVCIELFATLYTLMGDDGEFADADISKLLFIAQI